ncbi:hypothetical protein SDJN02_09757, partial [Cucurbita argyrosperma subsp. argyrosperma]
MRGVRASKNNVYLLQWETIDIPVFCIHLYKWSDFVPVKHSSSLASLTSSPSIGNQCCHSGRWRRSLRMLLKTLGCLSPICHKGDSAENISCDVQSQNQSPLGSSSIHWCHLESSIYEAILHCKRGIMSRTKRNGQWKEISGRFYHKLGFTHRKIKPPMQ